MTIPRRFRLYALPPAVKRALVVTMAGLLVANGLKSAPAQIPESPGGNSVPAAQPEQQEPSSARLDSLWTLGESQGDRLAGVLFIRDGENLGETLAATPLGRFLTRVRLVGLAARTGRWVTGLPVPPDAWEQILGGPALLLWTQGPSGDEPATASTDTEAGQPTAPAENASATPMTPAVSRPAPVLLVHFSDPEMCEAAVRWLATHGTLAARDRYADLLARRRPAAGTWLHLWERTEAAPNEKLLLAFAQRGQILILGSEENLVRDLLAVDALVPSSVPTRLMLRARGLLQASREEGGAPIAAVCKTRAFTVFRSWEWIRRGLGLDLVGRMADRLSGVDETTSAAVSRVRESAHSLAERAKTGGLGDLEFFELHYWPDPDLPHSLVRLVFSDESRTWMREAAASRPFRMPDLAPADCVGFWAARVPARLANETSEQGGPEIGRMFIPTRFRVAAVFAVESPTATAFLRSQMQRIDDFMTTTTLDMPVDIPLSGPWAKVKESLGSVEPWLPLVGVRWKVRLAEDYLVLSTSREALEKIIAVKSPTILSLRQSRPELFPVPTEPDTGRIAFERYNDIALRARSVRALDIVEFPFLEEPEQDAALYEINWLALAQKIPKVQDWLATLPPLHSRVVWNAESATLELRTQSASGLPGDLRVWGAAGASLIPTFDLNLSDWRLSLDNLNLDMLKKLDPREWFEQEEVEP